jgi:Right handed beta helix region/Protein of unknown function (DUF1565)
VVSSLVCLAVAALLAPSPPIGGAGCSHFASASVHDGPLSSSREPTARGSRVKRGGSRRFVSVRGSDSTGTGARRRPFRTLGKAASVARPGDTVYVRRGTYGRTTIQRAGTRRAPITFRAYPGERVVFDGAGTAMAASESLITIYKSANLILERFEIRNSAGRGLSVLDGRHVTVRDNTVHDTWAHPIMGSGDHLRFEGNHIFRGVLSNAYGARRLGYWPGALSTWLRSNGARSTNVTFRGNRIHDSWGEGLIALHANGVRVSQNTIYNVWSVDIYVTDAARVRVDGNYVYSTTAAFNRNGGPAAGIMLANEHYTYVSTGKRPVSDVIIANNIVANASAGVQYWHDPGRTGGNTYRNIRVYHNVFKDIAGAPFRTDAVPSGEVPPTGNVARNNFIYRGADGATLDIGNAGAWTFSFNAFPGGLPPGSGSSSFAGDPRFTRPVGGGPREGFKVRRGSPLIGSGGGVGEVRRDMWGTLRRRPPTVGVHEPLRR